MRPCLKSRVTSAGELPWDKNDLVYLTPDGYRDLATRITDSVPAGHPGDSAGVSGSDSDNVKQRRPKLVVNMPSLLQPKRNRTAAGGWNRDERQMPQSATSFGHNGGYNRGSWSTASCRDENQNGSYSRGARSAALGDGRRRW
jgi:hypothetical protein